MVKLIEQIRARTARHASVLRRVAAILSGLLLAAAFPPMAWQDAAWVALVPLLLSCAGASPRRAIRLGFTAGIACWLPSISWLIHVSVLGWVLLALYCALYFIPLSVVMAGFYRGLLRRGTWGSLLLMFLLTLTWLGSEYVRSTFATGFGWNTLAVSQYRNIVLLQVARWGGVYAVSALVLLVNAALALTLLAYAERGGRSIRRPHVEIMVALLLLASAFAYGWRTLVRTEPGDRALRVALVQPDIEQTEKWDAEEVQMIYQRLRDLTSAALRTPELGLVVWPETAVPDDIRLSAPSYDLVYDLATNGVPLLVGSMDTEWRDDLEPVYFNSSFLFDAEGRLVSGYDKRHLVIFGEYVPLQRWIPFISAMTPIQASFTPGTTNTVFRLPGSGEPFASLICFEDTVAREARRSVRNGARLLVNQTNDAWFDPSSASRQHMAHCVLRAVENGVPAIRAANTGVSCFIDAFGRVQETLKAEDGNVRFPGFITAEVRVPVGNYQPTFYTRHGDLLGIASTVATLFLLVGLWRTAHSHPAEA